MVVGCSGHLNPGCPTLTWAIPYKQGQNPSKEGYPGSRQGAIEEDKTL